jgi:hypothetical protein
LHFDISDNDIRAGGGKALVEALKGNQVITTLIIAKNNLCYNSSADKDMLGVAALADAIPGMGALSMLSLKNNRLATKEGGRALATALAVNSVLKELDLSCNAWDSDSSDDENADGPGFAQELARGIKDNGGGMSVLHLSENSLQADGVQIICEGVLDAARCVTSLLFDWLLNTILRFPKLQKSMPAAVHRLHKERNLKQP